MAVSPDAEDRPNVQSIEYGGCLARWLRAVGHEALFISNVDAGVYRARQR